MEGPSPILNQLFSERGTISRRDTRLKSTVNNTVLIIWVFPKRNFGILLVKDMSAKIQIFTIFAAS